MALQAQRLEQVEQSGIFNIRDLGQLWRAGSSALEMVEDSRGHDLRSHLSSTFQCQQTSSDGLFNLPLGGNHSLGWEASESLPCTWPPITTTTTGSTPINGSSTATMAPWVLSSYDSTGASALAASSGRSFFSQIDSPLNRPYDLWSLRWTWLFSF